MAGTECGNHEASPAAKEATGVGKVGCSGLLQKTGPGSICQRQRCRSGQRPKRRRTLSEPPSSSRVLPDWGTALADADYASLEKSWIDRESADAAMLRRVDAVEGRDIVGQKGNRDCSGILIPYYWPGEPRPFSYRIRRDNPEFTTDRYGGLKPDGKYLGAPGCANRLYVPPGVTVEQLEDVTTPVVIVEGEKKALAVWRLSNLGVAEPCWIVVAIAGVWCWRGRTGRDFGANGDRIEIKGPIPDLNRIAWEKREILILFDSNVHTNPSVRAARSELAKELTRRGGEVGFVTLPEDCGVNGVDDLLALWGPERVLDLFDAAESAGVKDQPTQAQVLMHLAQKAQLFHTPDRQAFALAPVGRHQEVLSLSNKDFRHWLTREFYREFRKPPGKQALQDALSLLEARALFESAETLLHVRVAEYQNKIYIDLCNGEREVIEISADGWKVISDAPVFFRRTKGERPLPRPVAGGSLNTLRRFINAGSDDNWVLLGSWLAVACRPKGPYPVLILQGEQGSAKSTTAKILRRLIDPSVAPVRSLPKDDRDLLIAANNSWLIAIDNISAIAPWLSDALCRLATGGGSSTRQLYSDSEEMLFDAARPIILNGIDHLAERADLAERALILNLPSIDEGARRDEAQLYADFERELPGILGALYTAVSSALARLPEIKLEGKPRMADFALWATATEQALGLAPGDFMRAYRGSRAEAIQETLEADPVASGILALVDRFSTQGPAERWTGTCTELLKSLDQLVDESTRKSRHWPDHPRGLSNRLNRLVPFLRESGIQVDRPRKGAKGVRRLAIARICGPPIATTATSATSSSDDIDNQRFTREHTGGGS